VFGVMPACGMLLLPDDVPRLGRRLREKLAPLSPDGTTDTWTDGARRPNAGGPTGAG